ncbi:c-type cytochrome [Azospirillum halopraeferens]|uniref:c-type cytochrome n=1 Tax=Azospirillum halopraeferens TaxID=34010 RepID=UPI000421C66E|nr:cytochrome c [Azospirillum halopraeferens]
MIRRGLTALLLVLVLPFAAVAAEPALTIAVGGAERAWSRDALLRHPDATAITVDDHAYGRPMTYRAVPLAGLVPRDRLAPGRVLEAEATDGFVAGIPVDLVFADAPGGAVPYLAVEPADAPWPALPGKDVSAGPFYVVWLRPAASGVRSEHWPYQVARITDTDSPAVRWPELAVDPALAADHPVRAGQALFVTQCMSCHTLNGAGSATMGPDLNRPMNPTEYLKPGMLHRLIRAGSSMRTWPERQMPDFTDAMLSDREIDRIVAYLEHMAGRK